MNPSPTPERHSISEALAGHAAPWRARSFLLAIAAMVVGAVLWISDATKRTPGPDGDNSSNTGQGVESAGARPAPPFLFRLGASYAAGFLFGWLLRRFLKTTALIAGVLVAAIALLKTTGWINLDWDFWRQQVSTNSSWLEAQAGALKTLLFGVLPSVTAAGAGSFFGWRRS